MNTHEGKILKDYIELNNVGVTHIANDIGVTRGNIYQLYGRDKLDEKLKEKIKSVYTDIDFAPKNESTSLIRFNQKGDGIPVFDMSFSAGKSFSLLEARERAVPVAHLNIPEVQGCDVVVWAKGDSMCPKINNRDWLGLKQLLDWREFFPKNYIYAIITNEQMLVKYVSLSRDKSNLIIKSENKNYEDDMIPVSLVSEFWQVKTILPMSKIEMII